MSTVLIYRGPTNPPIDALDAETSVTTPLETLTENPPSNTLLGR